MIPRVGELLAEKYQVEAIVGRGGMGVVLAARHLRLKQRVAIKLLDLPLDDARRAEWESRFFHEGRIAAALKSEHIVQVHDVGMLDSGLPYMVMELLSGTDLSALLALSGPLPVAQAVECVRQAATAIALAHRQGIIHRDLKPSNLFLTTRSDGSALIKVLDFGISKSLDEADECGSLTVSRAVLGSPFYMSPEQIRDAKRVDHRTDIWSLGAILHELLSGSPPFEADTLPAASAAIVADPPTPLGELRDDVPAQLESIVLRCLEKKAADRYNRAEDLLVMLEPFAQPAPDSPTHYEVSSGLAELSQLGAGVFSEDSARSVDAVAVTLQSEQPSASRTAPPSSNVAASEPSSAVQRGTESSRADTPRRWPAVAGAVLLLGIGSTWVLTGGQERAPRLEAPPVAAAAPLPVGSFALLIEARPGAEVYENNERLGSTPLSVKIDKGSVESKRRVFELRRQGYESYLLEQGPSTGDVRHVAALAKLSAPTAPASAVTAVPTGPRAAVPRPTRRPEVGKPDSKSSQGVETGSEPTDIRMSR